ncbi:COMM domain-containing protein 4 [Grus japonensis]|uniref:COMM domain-containing protein 4 n=1 Tax=Grus japonensis TaxID=30415 RepID=A0ABC9X8E7_GRUJA
MGTAGGGAKGSSHAAAGVPGPPPVRVPPLNPSGEASLRDSPPPPHGARPLCGERDRDREERPQRFPPARERFRVAEAGSAAAPGTSGDMRFRFCGDLDCPDWVLAEISTLAKISSVKLKLICAQVLRDLLGEAIEYEKILKLTSDAKLESGDVKATIAVLGFILSSAAKHNVDSESLSSELQQLGLPKEHASGLCRSYEEKQSSLQDSLRACSLRLNQLGSVRWRVDYTLSSSELREVNEPLVHLTFNLRDGEHGRTTAVPVALSADKFRVLLAELKQAQALMNTLL